LPPRTSRRAIVAQAIQARRPAATSGGTTAPRGRQGIGPNQPARLGIGIGPGRPARGPKVGIGQGEALPGGGGGAPSGTPGGIAPAPTPWNSRYEQTVSGARRKYLNAEGNLDLSEAQAKQEFGLDPGFNDYQSNPNSRAALLEQTYLNHNRGIMNSAGLQLYSGSTSNRLGNNRSAYGANRDQLASTYRDALGEIGAKRTQAAEEKAEAEQGAEWDRIGDAEKAPLDPEAAPGRGGKAPRGKAKTKARKNPDRAASTRGAINRSVPPRRRK